MRRVLGMLLVGVSSPAWAGGTLVVEAKLTLPAFVWIDGAPVGKMKGSHTAAVDAGVHEVWYAGDAEATTTYCHGTVTVADGATMTVSAKGFKCAGLELGKLGEKTAYKGATVRFRMGPGDDFAYGVQVDGGYSWPISELRTLNLTPGEHHLILGAGSDSDLIYDRGVVKMEQGGEVTVTCADTSCMGLLHP